MTTRPEVNDNDSSPGPSRSCCTALIHKWTCAALKTWLKVRGSSYSGMKKDELVAKLIRMLFGYCNGPVGGEI